MALRIWLPLNGTLENLGCSDSTMGTMGSGITYSAGKIGNAATFPNSPDSCIYTQGLKLQVFSWTAWIYVIGEGSGSRQYVLSEGRDTGSVGTNISLSKAGTTLYWFTHKESGSITISLNTWYHVALTADGNNIRFYLNGELKSTTPYTEDSDFAQSNDAFVLGKMAYSYTSTGSYFPFNGKLNDVRVYDHCLSAAEVHEISQGLVLHYKLDGTHSGVGENLLRTTPLTYTPADYRSYKVNLTENLVKGDTYTFQAWDVDVSHTGKTEAQIGFGLWWGGSSVNLFSLLGTSYFTDGHADYICKTFTAPNSTHAQTENAWIEIYNSPANNDGTRFMSIGKWKLEKGSKATGYIESDLDTEIDTTRVTDSSGYGHDGTIYGSVSISPDTPRYELSTYLNGSSAINAGRGGMLSDSLTVSMWVKMSALGRYASCFEGGGWGFQNNPVEFAVYVNGGYKYAKSTEQISTNTWHLLTGVYDRDNQILKLYIDGEKKGEGTTGVINPITYHGSNVVFIGAEATGNAKTPTAPYLTGNISDFRIYCTSLSDDDILSLYNIPARIDKSGNVHTFELKENDSIKISKKGVFAVNSAIETKAQKAKFNIEYVSTNEFIER